MQNRTYFIKQKIRETSAHLGGEMSGHIFFNDRWPVLMMGYMQEQEC